MAAVWTNFGWDGYCLLVSFEICADISLHRCHWCSVGENGWCSRRFESPSVLGRVQTTPYCDVSSQDTFYCSSVETDQSLALKFSLLEFPQKVDCTLTCVCDHTCQAAVLSGAVHVANMLPRKPWKQCCASLQLTKAGANLKIKMNSLTFIVNSAEFWTKLTVPKMNYLFPFLIIFHFNVWFLLCKNTVVTHDAAVTVHGSL